MAEQRIVRYRASWNPQSRAGVLELDLQGGGEHRIETGDLAEFTMLLAMFQKDSDPYLVDDTWISTGYEYPG